ncbi:unnamed protein product [Hydatigera taeniaeformis]|uniref:DNA methyltransferase 1-associated protein 1 n=1 Tax=Hydatigena taeniaeformis TaxID=6205 RepID=A0A158REV3_HYDTA|nr:unnamed protein product [Hydatigera taeniaeformis]
MATDVLDILDIEESGARKSLLNTKSLLARTDKDNLVLYHWRREDTDANEEYHFARLNKHMEVPTYTDADYRAYLQDSKWTLERTNHLMELARQFDVRFIHMHDRWDAEKFSPRPSLEELKARYYGILGILDKIRGTNLGQGLRYDIEHEKRRKQQLSLLYGRSKDEVEEEERLIGELERIEARRRERERKKQDLQKLISQAESATREFNDTGHDDSAGSRRTTSLGGGGGIFGSSTQVERRRSTVGSQGVTGLIEGLGGRAGGSLSTALAATSSAMAGTLSGCANLAFPDLSKTPGVHLNSQGMKLPASLGQKRIRVIENFLSHYQMDPSPPATKEIVEAYNRLRSNILLLYDLRGALLQCDYELHAARARMELFAAERIPSSLANLTSNSGKAGTSGPAPPPGVDASVLAALKAADSKRPAPPRHSFGHAGSLAAAAGTLGGLNAIPPPVPSPMPSPHTASSPSPLGDASPAYAFGGSQQQSTSSLASQRRKRAAAAEQGRVMKKLKTKGHLLE